MGAPSGGPVDDIPPTIINMYPADGDTLVPVETDIAITFSEEMDRNSVQSALFISPDPQSALNVSWKRNTLNIDLEDTLIRDQTYVISVGSSAEDQRNNPADKTFSFAFSTGEKLEKGIIPGKVLENGNSFTTQGVRNAIIWAYKIGDTSVPDPSMNTGEYITQTDADGNFQLTNLDEGTYRLFAITNDDQDFFFYMGSDKIGIPPGDIQLRTDEQSYPLTFVPVSTDTLPPQLYLLDSSDRNHINIHFDEPIDKYMLTPENFRILEFPGGAQITDAVKSYYYTESADNAVKLYTDALVPNQEYQIVIDGIADKNGNLLTDFYDSTTVFICSILKDTTKFNIEAVSPSDSTTDIPLYEHIILTFNQSVDKDLLTKHFQLIDSLDHLVSGKFQAVSSSQYHFIPDEQLQPLMKYEITVHHDSIQSDEGNILQSRNSPIVFTTMDENRTGALYGEITVIGEPQNYSVVAGIYSANSRENHLTSITLEHSGPYEFHGILPGEYFLTAFLDKDGNETWSSGRLKPFKPSEPFAVYPEEVTIRSGFDNVGINLTIYVH